MKLTIEKFREWVADSFFTVVFTKQDGSLRVMNARMNVSKYVQGTKPEVTAKRKATLTAQNMLTVYDLHKRAYRTINLDTLQLITCNGIKLIFEDGHFVTVEDKTNE